MISPWCGMLLVLAILGGLMATLRLLQQRGYHPELTRKLLHVGMGIVTLSFPWLFQEAWPVLVLGGLSIVLLTTLKVVPTLRNSVGGVVHGVSRASLGELYFPLAVTIVFLLYRHEHELPPERRILLYCIPVLLLTLADAVAALVGVSYGRSHYTTPDGRKSAEGSFAFLLCAFLCTHIVLLLGSDVPRAETLLIALLLGWLAMMFEAAAWGGLDNLMLPLAAYFMLRSFFPLTVPQLLFRLGMAAALTILVMVYRSRTTLHGSALVGAALVGYIVWALGGWTWLLAPLILFLCYARLSPQGQHDSRRNHNVHAVASVCSASLVWLFLASALHRPELLFVFNLAFAAHLAIIGLVRIGACRPDMSAFSLVLLSSVPAWLLLFVPYLCLVGWSSCSAGCTFAALPIAAMAAGGFFLTQASLPECPANPTRWIVQAFHAGASSLVGLVPLYVF